MGVTRALDSTGKKGSEWSPDVDASGNAAFAYNLGRLQSVAGTNAITADLTHPTGFTTPADGARADLIPAANNTDVVTLNIEGQGAISVRDQSGVALAADALVAGRLQTIVYNATAGYWMFAAPSIEELAAGAADVQTFLTTDTWVKPETGTMAFIQCWGGGGSGGRSSAGSGGGGGGGGYIERWMPLSALGATETVTIGAGGTPVSSNSDGNVGGNTTFGAHLTAYGGGGGAFSATTSGGGGGGSGAGAGSTGSTTAGGAAGGADASAGGAGNTAAAHGAHGGGGGGGGNHSGGSSGIGGNASFGGAGGGGSGAGTAAAGGTSRQGGNGGAGTVGGGTAVSGAQPGGGGGGAVSGTSGAGGAGKCVVTVF